MLVSQSHIRSFIQSFVHDERGATAIEYALIAGGLFMAVVLAVGNYATLIKGLFEMISSNVIPALG